MTLKQRLITGYLAVALLFGLYHWLFGAYTYHDLAYNLGRNITWHATIFPAPDWIFASIVIVLFVTVTTLPGFFAELVAKEKEPE